MKGKRTTSIRQGTQIKTRNKPTHRKYSKSDEEATNTSSTGYSADFDSNDGKVSHTNDNDKNVRPSLEPAPVRPGYYNNDSGTSDVRQDLFKSTRRMCDGIGSRPSTHLVDERSEMIDNGLLNKGLSYTVIPSNQRSHLKRPKIPSKSPERNNFDGRSYDEVKSMGLKTGMPNTLQENAKTASDRKNSTDVDRNKRESRSSETHLHSQNKRNSSKHKVTDIKPGRSTVDRNRRKDSEPHKTTTLATCYMSQQHTGTATGIPGPNPSIAGAARRVAGRFIASRTSPRVRMTRRGYRRERYVDVPWTYASHTASLPTTYQREKPKHASKIPLSMRMMQRKEEYRLQPTRQRHAKGKKVTQTACTSDKGKEEIQIWPDTQHDKPLPEKSCYLTTECAISPVVWQPGNVGVEDVTMTSRRPAVIPRYKSDISHMPGIRYVARTDSGRRKSATARKSANNKNAKNRNHEGDNFFTSLNPHKALPSIPHNDSRDVEHKVLPSTTMTNTARGSSSIASDSSSFNKQFTKSIRAKAATRRVSSEKSNACTSAPVSYSSNRQLVGKPGSNIGQIEHQAMSSPMMHETVDGWLDSHNSLL